tara:strand:- start:364 stop:567 length:204 start_codon:yes stop_codon:yes gene_type:complete
VRTTSLKTIYFTHKELKIAIQDFLTHRSGRSDLAQHMTNSTCEMEWAQKNGPGPAEFLVSVGIEVED